MCLVGHKSRKWGARSKLTRESRKDKISREASSSSIIVIENLPDLWHFILCLSRSEVKDKFEITLTLKKAHVSLRVV